MNPNSSTHSPSPETLQRSQDAVPAAVQAASAALSWLSVLSLGWIALIAGRVIDHALGSTPVEIWDFLFMGVFALAAATATATSRILTSHWQGRAEQRLRHSVTRSLFEAGLSSSRGEAAGGFLASATSGTEKAAYYRSRFLGPIIGSLTIPLAVLLLIGLTLNWLTAGLLLLGAILIPVIIGGFQAAFRKVSTEYRKSSGQLSMRFLDSLQGLSTLTVLNAADRAGKELAEANEHNRQKVMKLLAANQLIIFVLDAAVSLLIIALAAWLALAQLSTGSLTPGQAFALLLLAVLLLEPANKVGQFFYIGMTGRAAERDINALLENSASGEEAEEARREHATTLSKPSHSSPALQIDHLSFSYDETSPVFNDFSLRVEQGERIGIIAPSGTGKTTLAALISGDLRPDSGHIRLFGHDTAPLSGAAMKSLISTVPQKTYLFTGTLESNLRLASPSSSREELLLALAQAGLGEELTLDTIIGEQGLTLSGVQAQRVAIARALLKDTPLLILDEPTAQLDALSELKIAAALEALSEHRTVLVISHRQLILNNIDRVITLGESGTAQ